MSSKLLGFGNLTRDVELRYVGQDKKAVADLTVAMSNGYGDNERVAFIDCSVWNKAAEACSKFLRKGSKVYLEARPETQTWDDKDGNKRSKLVFTADKVDFLTPKSQDEESSVSAPAEAAEVNTEGTPF